MSKSDEWGIVAGGSEVLRVAALDDEGNPIDSKFVLAEGEVLFADTGVSNLTINDAKLTISSDPNTTAQGITFGGTAQTGVYRAGAYTIGDPQLNLPEDFNTLKAEVEALKAESESLRSLVGEMWGMIVDLTAIVDTKADSRRGRGQTQPRPIFRAKEIGDLVNRMGESNG